MHGKFYNYSLLTGEHTLHDTTNDNQQGLINFEGLRNIVVGTTLYPHKNIHRGTHKYSHEPHPIGQL